MTDKTKFKIHTDTDEGTVGICYHEDDCNYLTDCVSIWIDDGDEIKSPFKSKDEAIAIARIFAKILNMVV